MNSLKTLKLSRNSLGDELVGALSQIPAACPLEFLELGQAGVGNAGVVAISSALCVAVTLQRVDLSGNCIDDAACLRGMLEGSQIRHLDLSGNTIGDEGAVHLSQSAKGLQSLVARGCGVTEAGLLALLGLESLTSLDLCQNAASVLAGVCDALSSSAALTSLDLSLNNIENAEAVRLVLSLIHISEPTRPY
eukprot:TRINITY_DN17533_c0_g1_i1.p2 TRINITY_DN17533_c0_g1~~TRINITY_DN17533_c0_g1_i1.p2  ORF type:complete len:192 (+),score=46.42 TRINITY_DN17533_c0_g1_i1:458-1033(+)